MSSFLYRLGRRAARRRVLVVLLWLLVLGGIGGACVLFQQGTDDAFAIPGSQSQAALDHLDHVFPQVSGVPAQLVLLVPPGRRADTPEVRAAVAAAVTRIQHMPQVAGVMDPFGENVSAMVSRDGRAVLVNVVLSAGSAAAGAEARTGLSRVATDLAATAGPGARVYLGGDAFADRVPRFGLTEGAGLLIALVVLLLMFRSLIAALMPLLTAVLGVGVSVSLIFLVTTVRPISSTAPMLAVMIGLAVGIDYALFLLSRHRDQLAEGLGVEESIARTTATAGSAVLFAGLTVMIALLGLAVAGIPFLTIMGAAAALAVAVAVCVAVTLVPALLSIAGDRLRPRPGRLRRAFPRVAMPSFGRWWVHAVAKVPVLTVTLVVAGLGVCAVPALHLRLALPDNSAEAPASQARQTYDLIAQHFGPGYNGPLLVTADIITSTDPLGLVGRLAAEIRAMPDVAAVPLATPDPGADTAIIQVIPTTAPDSPQTEKLVTALRAKQRHFQQAYGTTTAVTGLTAVGIDVSAHLRSALLPFGILVVGLSLVLLAMVMRSIWVPVKAAAGFLLSVGAAFGATSYVFVQGHGAGLLHITHTGNVISFLPIILMGVLFGLAMDYEIFLVSRIREHYVHNGQPREAVTSGFVSASRVVTAAAVIMFGVFAAFVPQGSTSIKQIAFSLAVGVFVDAFLVRMTLVPAVLALLGRRAWRLPRFLDRALPIFDAEGGALVQELRLADWPPGRAEAVSARDLCLEDDFGQCLYDGIGIHLPPGDVLVVHGGGPAGRSALLLTLAGRVTRFGGDLKVLGRVLPQHTHAVRRRVEVIGCRQTPDPVPVLARALADNITLVLIDDVDLVLATPIRDTLRDLFTSRTTRDGQPVTVVLTCHDPDRIGDLLPDDAHLLPLTRVPVEVS
ncbi:MAG TPA: MMPL family transporter [Rugosimonospora sp.]|nr:MMPL family transporter [Rugosimonospora sp.]